MGTVITLQYLEPETDPTFQQVSILDRGPSRTSDQTAARSEPQIQIALDEARTLRLPSLYYALHPELQTACLRTAYGRFSGAGKYSLVPPQNCP